MYTIRNILYSIKKYRYVRTQWTFKENIEFQIVKKLVFINVCVLLLTFCV